MLVLYFMGICSVDSYFSGLRRESSVNTFQHGGFTASVRSDDTNELPGLYFNMHSGNYWVTVVLE